MYKIALINMPFAALNSPSLALTQLKSVLDSKYKNRVSVEINYLNHDFAHYMGIETCQFTGNSLESHNSWLGDWFFRQSAFPEQPDNAEVYFQRYFPLSNQRTQMLKRHILEKRQWLDHFLDSLIDKYELDQADLVGFTSMFSQNVACFAMARHLKARNPDLIIVMGGANCEPPMGQEIVKNVKHIDFVFSGPALKSFPEFVQYCLDQEMTKCNKIKGVFAKTNCDSGVFGINGWIGEELDINIKVGLDYEPFLNTFEKNFSGRNLKPILYFETSRGCWWGERAHCTFCGLNGTTMQYRAMSPERTIEQFKSLFKYSSRCDYFECVDNIMPKSYPREVFPFICPPANVSMFYEVKADLSEEDLLVLSKARVKCIQPGIESLATSTLKLMKKGTTVFQNLRLLKNCVIYEVYPVWNLLIGFPGESEEVYRQYVRDIPLLIHLPPPSGVFPVRFDRFSPYFVQAKQYGLDLHPHDFYELTYPFSKKVLTNLAYNFVDHNFGAEYFVIMVKWIDTIQEKVDLWRNRWHDEKQTIPPKVFLKEKDKTVIVYDSRSGEVLEHPVGRVGKQVLEYLVTPRKITDLASDLNHISNFDPEKEIAFLKDRGLVFQEGERFLSLVHLNETSPANLKVTWKVLKAMGRVNDGTAELREPAIVPVSRDTHRIKLSSLVKNS